MITSGLNLSGGMIAQELNAPAVAVKEPVVVVRRTRVSTGATPLIGGGGGGGGYISLGLSTVWREDFYDRLSDERIDTIEERLERSIGQLTQLRDTDVADHQDPIWGLFTRTLEKATRTADEARLKQASRRFADVMRFSNLLSELQSAVAELQQLKQELERRQVISRQRVVVREVVRERPVVRRIYEPVYLSAETYPAATSGWLTRTGAALPAVLFLAGVALFAFFYFRMKKHESEARKLEAAA